MAVKRPAQPFDMVEIVWDDTAAHENVWMEEITKLRPHLVHSVGFLVYLKKDYAVIAQDVDHEGQHNGRTQIPRAMIRLMRVLRRKDGKRRH